MNAFLPCLCCKAPATFRHTARSLRSTGAACCPQKRTVLKRVCSDWPPCENFACCGMVSRTKLHGAHTSRRSAWTHSARRNVEPRELLRLPCKAHEHGVELVVITRTPVLISLCEGHKMPFVNR